MELRKYWDVLRRRNRLFLLVMGGIVTLTLIWAFSATRIFMATAKVVIKMQDATTIVSSIVPSALGRLEFTSSSNAVATVIEMIKNYDSLDKLIDDLKLMKRNGSPFSSIELLNSSLLNLSINKTGIKIDQVTNSDVIEIIGFSEDPAIAVKISNTITYNTLKMLESINRGVIEHTIDILTKETSRLKYLVTDSEDIVKKYKINNEAVSLDEKISAYMTQLVTTELSIIKMSTEKNVTHPDLKAELEQIAHIKSQLKNIPVKQFDLSELQRISTSINTVYTTLLSDLEKAKILKEMSISNILVIEKAKIPDANKKYYIYFPKKKLMLMLSLIIGSFLGVIAVFFAEYIDDTIKNSTELKAWTGQKVLAAITLLIEAEVFPPRDSSPIYNAINDLWLSIIIDIKSHENKKQPRILTITSYGEKEGKSLVTAYLGYLLSKIGFKTLIIDFNFDNPSLSHVFKQTVERGTVERELTDYVATGRENKIDELQIFNKLDDNLFFLPNSLLTGEQHIPLIKKSSYILNLIEIAKNEFDMIVFDSSPLSKSKESYFIASESDAAILVVEAGKYQLENILWAIQELNESGVIIAGLVLNKHKCTSF
jgi:uncharacterized protein involved in exopolysaccharide biosynthesis/Mrp family chromosome partitioning ATPase